VKSALTGTHAGERVLQIKELNTCSFVSSTCLNTPCIRRLRHELSTLKSSTSRKNNRHTHTHTAFIFSDIQWLYILQHTQYPASTVGIIYAKVSRRWFGQHWFALIIKRTVDVHFFSQSHFIIRSHVDLVSRPLPHTTIPETVHPQIQMPFHYKHDRTCRPFHRKRHSRRRK
jgi:hypothetical protein